MGQTLSILHLSSLEDPPLFGDLEASALSKELHLNAEFINLRTDAKSHSASASSRIKKLSELLVKADTCVIWSARGGYGASELLEHLERIDWPESKILVGFSDTSALHSARYARNQAIGLHAPMPATQKWVQGCRGKEQTKRAIQAFMGIIPHFEISLPLDSPFPHQGTIIKGKAFGGCWSVLSQLIGTPYFPPQLQKHVLFLEDINESPQRLLRYLDQWRYSGAFKDCHALILGSLIGEGFSEAADRNRFIEKVQSLVSFPVLSCTDFGHGEVNLPLPIGAEVSIDQSYVTWNTQLLNQKGPLV